MNKRVKALKGFFEPEELDGYLVSNEINIRYLSGFLGGSRLLIPKEDTCTLSVHTVNYEVAKEYVKDMDIEPAGIGENVDRKVSEYIKRLRFKRVGFDLENVEFKPLRSLVESLRRVKDEEELRAIKKAADLASLGMNKAFEIIKPGLRERELASEIEYTMRTEGSNGSHSIR